MYIEIEQKDISDFHNEKVILFGAGSCGLRALEEFEKVGANIVAFCDNNSSLAGSKLMGYSIISPDEIALHSDTSVIITSTYDEEIKKQLDDMGIVKNYIAKVGVLKSTIPFEHFENSKLSGEEANNHIYKGLTGDNPFLVGRLGSVELECLCHYLYFLDRKEQEYPPNVKMIMNINAGFFPKEDHLLDDFNKLYIENLKNMDLIWTMWCSKFENKIYQDIIPNSYISAYDDTYFPVQYKSPWTQGLKGKRVLVVHPFSKSIKENYKIIDKIHPDGLMPQFELITLEAVQSIAGTKTEFGTWFEALQYMERKIDQIEFDVALIGAGAYGLPLAAYIKSIGKKAIHVGGALQLYFGIKGKAWNKLGIYNAYWTSPLENEKPEGFQKVEAGRYW